ncbi:MAG: bifunctional DNA-formamidopyrimidine glycosylase/DNA-(apurinic or apyrimidinic site) lyase [Mariprofundaceae bacterium]
MPELPEVEVVRTGLEPLMTERRVQRVQCFRENLRYPLPPLASLAGCRFVGVARRAKYLLFALDDERRLIWHLGMTGQFHVLDAGLARQPHEHVRITLDNGRALVYRDARRFGYAGLMDGADVAAHPWFSGLGPEPLGDEFNGEYLADRCRGKKQPIKTLLMDGRVVVGVGNIYAAESLFRAGIHPARAAGRISALRLKRLHQCVRQVLAEAIAAGGSSISDFVHADGKPGYFSHAFRVYGRQGLPCPVCARPVKRIVQGGRSSFYCSGCQH